MIVLDDFNSYADDAALQAAWVSSNTRTFSLAHDKDYALTSTNERSVIPAANISASGSKIVVRINGHTTKSTVITGASIGERSGTTGNYASTPTRLTFGGNNGCTITAGSYIDSDEVDFNLDETKTYLFHLCQIGGSANHRYKDVGYGRYYRQNSTLDDLTMIEDISTWGFNNDARTIGISSISIINILMRTVETSTKYEGAKSMKVVAPQTTSLNATVTRTLSPTWNLSGQNDLNIWVRASRTGTNFKLGIHDSGGTTTESNIAISVADTWELKTIDISAVADADKDAIDSIILTITNADAENTIYLDYLHTMSSGEGTGSGGGISRSRIIGGV